MASSITSALRSAVGVSPTAASIKQNCRKVVCIGRNYADHISELNSARPSQPFFFLKPPSSILLPPTSATTSTSNPPNILRPLGVTLHYEVELGLVLGQPVRDLDPNDEAAAMAAISHYILGIDMTARNVQDEAKKKGLPWSIAKGFDTFLPISSPVAASDPRLQDPYKAELWLKVNGQTRQEDSIGLMLFRIPRILGDISSVMALEAGDVVLTGTPKGVGKVEVGDVMTAGLRVDGKDVEELSIEVGVEDKGGRYEYRQT